MIYGLLELQAAFGHICLWLYNLLIIQILTANITLTMNIVITLPTELIAAILDRKKSIEVRSKLPLYFDSNNDVVFVAMKETHKIPIYFTVKNFVVYDSSYMNDEEIANAASVPVKWIADYRTGKRFVYVWVIGYVCELTNPVFAWNALQMTNNPQSFIYKNYHWEKLRIHRCFASWQMTYDDMNRLMQPIKRQKDWLRKLKKAIQ